MFLKIDEYDAQLNIYCIVDSDFTQKIAPIDYLDWTEFFATFIKAYEDRGIKPFPELIRYAVWFDKNSSISKSVLHSMKFYLPQYYDDIEKYLVLT